MRNDSEASRYLHLRRVQATVHVAEPGRLGVDEGVVLVPVATQVGGGGRGHQRGGEHEERQHDDGLRFECRVKVRPPLFYAMSKQVPLT